MPLLLAGSKDRQAARTDLATQASGIGRARQTPSRNGHVAAFA